MKTRAELEKLVEMASRKPLMQKPSEVLGKDALKFIKMFAEEYPSEAFFSGIDLKDDSLTKAALVQISEQGSDKETLIEAYKFQKKNGILDNNQEYRLRQIAVEVNPKGMYSIDLEEAAKESEDNIVTWTRNRDLRQSRQYFAMQAPFEAYDIQMEKSGTKEFDEDLRALARPNMVLSALRHPRNFQRLGEIARYRADDELGMMTANAALEILEQSETNKSINRERSSIATAAYLGARSTYDSYLQDKAREAYIKHDLRCAALLALDEGNDDSKLGRIVIQRVLGQIEEQGKSSALNWADSRRVAYEICRKYKLNDLQDKIREVMVSEYPKSALDYGLKENDKKLVKMARAKLIQIGEKVDEAEIRLFQR